MNNMTATAASSSSSSSSSSIIIPTGSNSSPLKQRSSSPLKKPSSSFAPCPVAFTCDEQRPVPSPPKSKRVSTCLKACVVLDMMLSALYLSIYVIYGKFDLLGTLIQQPQPQQRQHYHQHQHQRHYQYQYQQQHGHPRNSHNLHNLHHPKPRNHDHHQQAEDRLRRDNHAASPPSSSKLRGVASGNHPKTMTRRGMAQPHEFVAPSLQTLHNGMAVQYGIDQAYQQTTDQQHNDEQQQQQKLSLHNHNHNLHWYEAVVTRDPIPHPNGEYHLIHLLLLRPTDGDAVHQKEPWTQQAYAARFYGAEDIHWRQVASSMEDVSSS